MNESLDGLADGCVCCGTVDDESRHWNVAHLSVTRHCGHLVFADQRNGLQRKPAAFCVYCAHAAGGSRLLIQSLDGRARTGGGRSTTRLATSADLCCNCFNRNLVVQFAPNARTPFASICCGFVEFEAIFNVLRMYKFTFYLLTCLNLL